jgi:hypothetical protein
METLLRRDSAVCSSSGLVLEPGQPGRSWRLLLRLPLEEDFCCFSALVLLEQLQLRRLLLALLRKALCQRERRLRRRSHGDPRGRRQAVVLKAPRLGQW